MSKDIEVVCASDLMNDVLASVEQESLLLTGLTNLQVVKAAGMAGAVAICFVRGKLPDNETGGFADEQGMPLLTTELTMYDSCGRLYQEDISSCDEPE